MSVKRMILIIMLSATSTLYAAIPETFDAGLGIGYTNYSVSKGNIPSLQVTATVDSTTYNLKAFGSYYFDELLGISMDFLAGGSVSATDQGVTEKLFTSSMLTLAAIISFPVTDRVELHAKVGGTSWQFSSQGNTPIDNGFGPSFGLGADFNIYGGSERRLRLEWNHYQLDNVYVKDANDFSINMVFFFKGK